MSIRFRLIFAFTPLLFMAGQGCRTDAPGRNPKPYGGPVFSSDPLKALTNNTFKTWKPLFYTRNGQVLPVDTCEQDDFFTFFANGDLQYKWGSNHCYLNEPDTETSNWGFNGSVSFIHLGTANFEVYELFEQSFVITWKEISGNDTTVRSKHFLPVQ